MSDATEQPPKVIAAVVCDFAQAAIGTRSRLLDEIGGKPVLHHVLARLSQAAGVSAIALLVPEDQLPKADGLQSVGVIPIHTFRLTSRSDSISARLRIARQWNLHAWRGGAGQATCFDEEYHPAAIAHAARELAADHVLVVHSHSLFLDIPITSALIHHHLHKNHEMRLTYTPCAPGLSGMVLQAPMVHEMGEKAVFPWQLLAYDPANPTFDTLIREACMQVDPALSKIPNRFCVDTDRSWQMAKEIFDFRFSIFDCGTNADHADRHETQSKIENRKSKMPTAADLALAAARTIAPGVRDFTQTHPYPRELEIELTGCRRTNPPGCVPALIRDARGELDAAHWTRWLENQKFPDDLLLTFAGDGDPLLYPHLLEILRAARKAKPLSINLQTDLVSEPLTDSHPLLLALHENLFDILSITTYGHTPQTYAKVAQADLHPILAKNLALLAPLITAKGGTPLVVPRLLKVRETIGELEPFFDAWIQQAGWAVIDYPTDRGGQIPFVGVIDMAPPKRRPCRRLWDRLLIRANGAAVACDQDLHDRLALGNIESANLEQMWTGERFKTLRTQHADGQWSQIDPCRNCREWHRA